MNDKEFLALAIFALTYLIILAGENSPRKLDRPAAGLLGAILMVATGVLTRREAAASLDLGTLALLPDVRSGLPVCDDQHPHLQWERQPERRAGVAVVEQRDDRPVYAQLQLGCDQPADERAGVAEHR